MDTTICAAPLGLGRSFRSNPGLTSGATLCRLFEAPNAIELSFATGTSLGSAACLQRKPGEIVDLHLDSGDRAHESRLLTDAVTRLTRIYAV